MNKLKSSHLNLFESSLIVVGTLLVGLGIYLGQNLSNIDLISSELVMIGNNEAGIAKRKTERSISWGSINSKDKIFNNDQVFTNTQQNLDINLKNKTRLNIKPNSLLRIQLNDENQISLDLGQGNVEVDATKVDQAVEIKRNDAVVEIKKGSTVKVEKIEGAKYGVKLVKGSASLIRKKGGKPIESVIELGKPVLVNLGEDLVEKTKAIEIIETQTTPIKKGLIENDIIDRNIEHQEIIKLNNELPDPNAKYVYVKSVNNPSKPIKIKVEKNAFNVSMLTAGKYIVSDHYMFPTVDSFRIFGQRKDVQSNTIVKGVENKEELLEKKVVDLSVDDKVSINKIGKNKNLRFVYIKPLALEVAPSRMTVVGNTIKASALAVGSYLVSSSPAMKTVDILEVQKSRGSERLVVNEKVDISNNEKVILSKNALSKNIKYAYLKPAYEKVAPVKISVSSGIANVQHLTVGKYLISKDPNLNEVDSFDIIKSEVKKNRIVAKPVESKYVSLLESNEVDMLKQDKIGLQNQAINNKVKSVYIRATSNNKNESVKVLKANVVDKKIDVSGLSFGKYLVSPTPDFASFDSLDIVASKQDPINVESREIDYDEPVKVKLNVRKGIQSKVTVEYPKLKQKKEYIVEDNDFSFPSLDQESIKISVAPIIASAALIPSVGLTSPVVGQENMKLESSASAANDSLIYKKNLDLKLKDPYQVKEIKAISLEEEIVTSIKINRPFKSNKHVANLINKDDKKVVPIKVNKRGVLESKNLKAGDYRLEVVNNESGIRLLDKDIIVGQAVLIKQEKVDNKKDVIINTLTWDVPGEKDAVQKVLKQASYQVEVFDSANKLVLQKELSKNTLNFESKKVSDYRIKVSKKNAGKLTPLGEKSFKVKPPKNLHPKELKKYVMKYNSKKLCYEVELPTYHTAQKYFIEIYRDSEMKKIVREIWSDESNYCWRSNRDGKYFFRYKYIDYWGSGSRYSDISEIIFPISPLTDF
ncbi:FecR domain-containing protein [Halobacteriovorax sp. GFR7]|uniref:FecR domain-containing protein n=1 Tax=unclassified Halobacteriovorax TaxID=2639665 RepID=UPI003D976588